jgi:hypothetical protein
MKSIFGLLVFIAILPGISYSAQEGEVGGYQRPNPQNPHDFRYVGYWTNASDDSGFELVRGITFLMAGGAKYFIQCRKTKRIENYFVIETKPLSEQGCKEIVKYYLTEIEKAKSTSGIELIFDPRVGYVNLLNYQTVIYSAPRRN